VKREAEVARGVDGDTDEDAGATRGADGGVGAARDAGRCDGGGSLRSTCNRRGVGWSNWSNHMTGQEEGVQVIGRCTRGGKMEG
jgi:hypothetical protein